MARLTLEQVKTQKISRMSTKSDYIPANDPMMFGLLKDNRCADELFSRVDKFWVNHYYYVGTQQLKEVIFYPSGYGLEQINSTKKHPCKQMYDRLLNEGIGLTGERPIANIEKPVGRLQLECKPKRMALACNE